MPPSAPHDPLHLCRWDSPLGTLVIGCTDSRLCLCDWAASRRHDANLRRTLRLLHLHTADLPQASHPLINSTIAQLREYFAGRRRDFDILLQPAGTDFQRRIWAGLLAVPYGTAIGYADLARRIGSPASVRAVANAVASNPISIIIPCHRIIATARGNTPATASDALSPSRLTGYAGGLPAKLHLLRLESDIPEGVKHWHGAQADSWMQHLTYHTNLRAAPSNEWIEPVDDQHYDNPPHKSKTN